MKKIQPILGVLMASMLLTACGGTGSSNSNATNNNGSNGNNNGSNGNNSQNTEKRLEIDGRLLVVNDDQAKPELSVYDLSQKKIVQSTFLDAQPTALYSSPSFGYGILFDRVKGKVNFYDGGLTQTKDVITEQKPQLLTHQILGAAPTHYRFFSNQAAIFFDGSDTETSKFEVFSDADIAKKQTFSEKLPAKHHGVAEPLGDYVLSSVLPVGATKVSLVKSYEVHHDHYHEHQSLVNECPGLHGASSIQKFSAFGCEDGVLLVERQGAKFVDTKLPLSVRIGTVVGHHLAQDLVALSSATPDLFIIDALKKTTRQISWTAQADTKRLKQAYSSTGQYFVVLDSTGALNIFDAKTWALKSRSTVLNIDPAQLALSQLVVHGQRDEVYLGDTQNKSIIHVDLKTGDVKQRIQLQTVPSKLTWVGAK